MAAASNTFLNDGIYGRCLGRHFGVDQAPAIAARTPWGSLLLAVTRLRHAAVPHPCETAIPFPRTRAFIVMARLSDHAHARMPWPTDEPLHSGSYTDGSVSIVDLEREPPAEVADPFDCLYFYVPRAALDKLADESGVPRIKTLSWTRAAPDPVVGQLGSCLVPFLDRPEEASPLFVDHVARALLAHFAHVYGGMQVAPRAVVTAGGLAPWQERRAKEMLSPCLGGGVPLSEVAGACGLSVSHFARAFRRSTGRPPHRWLSERRVDRAKELLRASAAIPLAEVAFACGFGDQSHFTRVFTRTVGTSPGAWRRVQNEHGGQGAADASRPAVGDGGVQKAA